MSHLPSQPARPTALAHDYLLALGLAGREAELVGLRGLELIHAAHVYRFAHDTVWVARDRIPPCTEADLVAALVAGEGGMCFHLAVGTRWLLRQLGYDARLHGATTEHPFDADHAKHRDHACVIVTLDGREFLVDTALGTGPDAPMPMVDGVVQQGPFTYELRENEGRWTFVHDPRLHSIRTSEIDPEPCEVEDLIPAYEASARDHDSRFVQHISAGIRSPGRVSILLGATVLRFGEGRRKAHQITDPAEWSRVLREEFRLDLPGLTDAELAALWART